MKPVLLSEISIRTTLRPGDIGYLIYLHGELYNKEYQYGIDFECYVAKGLTEFYSQYNAANHRVWICEHQGKMIGFMLLMNRGEEAQLRYFLISPEYRGIGLGRKLMDLYMEFAKSCGYKSSFLWTTSDQTLAAALYAKYGFRLTEEKETTSFGKVVKEQRYEISEK